MKSVLPVDYVCELTGMTQGQISEVFGVRRETVCRWKRVPKYVESFLKVYAMHIDLRSKLENRDVEEVRKEVNRRVR